MSNHYFLDTSALAKYYHIEPGSDQVARIIEDTNSTVVFSPIAILEFHSQLALKVRDTSQAKFNTDSFHKVCGLFCYHIVRGRFSTIDLPEGFVFIATDLIRDYGCNRSLRHMDAIQLCNYLAYLQLHSDAIFVSSDKKLLGIVKFIGLRYFNPEDPCA